MKSPLRTGIALGSNQGDRMAHLQTAFQWLKTMSDGPVKCSRVYETAPIDCPKGTSLFLNAVCEITFEGDVFELLAQMGDFERQRGRPTVYPKNSPRSLDMDLLYAGDLVVKDERLTLPHPRMLKRRFVLRPLCDIQPELVLPNQTQNVSQLLAGLKDHEDVHFYHESLE